MVYKKKKNLNTSYKNKRRQECIFMLLHDKAENTVNIQEKNLVQIPQDDLMKWALYEHGMHIQ